MKGVFGRFVLINSFYFLLLFLLIWFGFSLFFKSYNNPWFVFIPGFACLINILVFYIASLGRETKPNLSQVIMKSFMVKFFCYIGITLIFFFSEKELQYRIIFILLLFVCYIVFTFLEVIYLVKLFKQANDDLHS